MVRGILLKERNRTEAEFTRKKFLRTTQKNRKNSPQFPETGNTGHIGQKLELFNENTFALQERSGNSENPAGSTGRTATFQKNFGYLQLFSNM